MPHIDPEQLALLALGDDPAIADERGHLDGCAQCRGELDGLRRTVNLARAGDGDDGWLAEQAPMPAPPSRVWDAIDAEVRADRETAAPAQAAVRPLHERPVRARLWWLAAACVVGLVVGAVLGAGARWNSRETEQRTEVVAGTSLAALAGTPRDADGRAEVIRVGDRLQLRVDARNLPLREGFYEVWMFDPATNKMQPMGTLDIGHRTSFAIPAGFDIAKFAGIDVSAEPFDGNPAHSAESVLRGTLRR